MKSSLLSLSLTSLVCAVSIPTSANYDGFKVFRITHQENSAEINSIISSLNLATWKNSAKAGFSDIVVPPSKLTSFQSKTSGLAKTTMHDDLGAAITNETYFGSYQTGSANSSWFTSYHAYADHLSFLNDLQAMMPNNSEIVTSGKSVQGRDITGIHFWGSPGKSKKPAVVFHSTVHAREWITTMVNEYVAYMLISKYSSDATMKSYIDSYDWYIFPVVNPDGFVYTQTTDRLWRKNRQSLTGASCAGRDINRNWPFKWDLPDGASTNPCAEDYKGVSAADAPETVALQTFIDKLAKTTGVKLYIDWHSYSQLFMYPYGYSCDIPNAKSTEFQSLSKGAVAALKAAYGTSYQYGPVCSTIYQVSGGSIDYINDVTKSDYTFTLELRDTGKSGFVLPPAQIQPTVIESFEAVKYLLANIK